MTVSSGELARDHVTVEGLIDPLFRATENASLKWKPDPTGGYVAEVGPNVVNVYKRDEIYTIRVLDGPDSVVDWSRPASDADQDRLGALYVLAGRNARNVDVVLSDILHRLEAAGGP